MHHYPRNVADWRKKTAHLNFLEKAIYSEFIDTYYLDETFLDKDLKKLFRAHGIRNDEEKEAARYVLEDFFILKDDGYYHDKCIEVLEGIYLKSKKAKIAACSKWIKKYTANGQVDKAAAKQKELDILLYGRIQNAENKSTENSELCKKYANADEIDANAEKTDAEPMPPNTHNPIPITHNPVNTHTQEFVNQYTHELKPIPDDFNLTDEMATWSFQCWADEMVVLVIESVFTNFKNHYISTQKESCNWVSMWCIWCADKKTLDKSL